MHENTPAHQLLKQNQHTGLYTVDGGDTNEQSKKRPPPQAQLHCYTFSPVSPPLPLTCVLSELVHGMQINDVGREARVHLAEDNTTTARVAPDDCLDVMTDSRAVGPPASVLVQPFPYHHGGC